MALRVWLFILCLFSACVRPCYAVDFMNGDYHHRYDHLLTSDSIYGPLSANLSEDYEYSKHIRYDLKSIFSKAPYEITGLRFYLRSWLNFSSDDSNRSNTDEDSSKEGLSLQFREFYVEKNIILSDPRFKIRFGRQRYMTERGLWWDDSVESLSLFYKSTWTNAFLAYVQPYYRYDTLDNKLSKEREDKSYFIGEYSYRVFPDHTFGVRYMYESDFSSKLLKEDRYDIDAHRLGLFVSGSEWLDSFLLGYYFDIQFLEGEVSYFDKSNSYIDSDIEGWAAYIEASIKFDQILFNPKLSVIKAQTSTPKENDFFIGTGLQSNTAHYESGHSNGLLGSLVKLRFQNLDLLGFRFTVTPATRSYLAFGYYEVERKNVDSELYPIALSTATISPVGTKVGSISDIQLAWKSLPRRYYGHQFILNVRGNFSYFTADEATLNLDNRYQFILGFDLNF